MSGIFRHLRYHSKELAYQAAIMTLLFAFFSYQQGDVEQVSIYALMAPYKFAFFCNYMGAATLINYVLLPRFYYEKHTGLFFVLVSVLIALVILVDEYILEQIYFPDTRGTYFPGIAFTLFETLPIIIIAVAFKFAWDFNKKQREIERLKILVKESELQFLKSQINPHFLFNNLNNLYAYAMVNSPKTPSIILELASVLRYMLYDCKEDVVPLSKEIKHLKNYTALNELQIAEERGTVRFSEEIVSGKYAISPLILVVFVENAFKHSTESQSKGILIDVHVEVSEKGLLTFSCNNSFSREYATGDHKGIGLENVKKRLHLLYPKKHRLDIKKSAGFYSVILVLQLKPIDTC